MVYLAQNWTHFISPRKKYQFNAVIGSMAPLAQKVKSICLHIERLSVAINDEITHRDTQTKSNQMNEHRQDCKENHRDWRTKYRKRKRIVVDLNKAKQKIWFYLPMKRSGWANGVTEFEDKTRLPQCYLLCRTKMKSLLNGHSSFVRLVRLDLCWCHSETMRKVSHRWFKGNKLATAKNHKLMLNNEENARTVISHDEKNENDWDDGHFKPLEIQWAEQ